MDNDGFFLHCFLVAHHQFGEREDVGFGGSCWKSQTNNVFVSPDLDRDGLKASLYDLCYNDDAETFHVLMGYIGNHFVIRVEMEDGWRNRLVLPMDQWDAGNKRHYDQLRKVVKEVNASLEAQYAADKAKSEEKQRLLEAAEQQRQKLRRLELYRELKQEFEGAESAQS